MKNIWQKLKSSKTPFFVLAPMDDVTDTVFRQMVAKHAPADLMMTEFANSDGWCSAGKSAIAKRLKHTSTERPLIAQIWGANPQHFYQMAKDITKLGFDGIDINMGCPINTIIKDGSCSALIQNPALASEIIQATKEGGAKLPVSVKTRIGFNKIETEEWIGFLLNQNLDALTVHGRTKKQKSKVDANWDEITKAVELKNKISPATVVVGNGDVASLPEGSEKAEFSGVDGVMIGRAIFQNFYIFSQNQNAIIDIKKMLLLLKEHTQLHQKTWGKTSSRKFQPLKKFVKMYIHGYADATRLRNTLMNTSSHEELIKEIDKALRIA